MKKPEWKSEFDKQVSECSLELLQLYEEYPAAVLHEAMQDHLSDRHTKRYRRQFQEMFESDDVENE